MESLGQGLMQMDAGSLEGSWSDRRPWPPSSQSKAGQLLAANRWQPVSSCSQQLSAS